MKPLYLL